MHLEDKGIIYVASGDRYVEEAIVSARSVKKVMPDISVHLHTDQAIQMDCFDEVTILTDCRYNCYDKVPPLLGSPFQKTLFLDTDTYVCDSVYEVFDLLEKYDFLLTHTPFRDPNPIEGIPAVFTELNTGVIGIRKNEITRGCLENWVKIYSELGHRADQPSFRKMIWEDARARLYVLPPEYNLRTVFPGFIGGGSRVKIAHGRHKNWDVLVKKLNANRDPRVVVLTPTDKIGSKVIVIRTWMDLLKSWMKQTLRVILKK